MLFPFHFLQLVVRVCFKDLLSRVLDSKLTDNGEYSYWEIIKYKTTCP